MTNQQTTLQEGLQPEEHTALQQGVTQDQQRALQEGMPGTTKAAQAGRTPHYPIWPTSKPGPQNTLLPPGTRPATPLRSEQVTENTAEQAGETLSTEQDGAPDYNSPKKPRERL